MDDRQRRNKIGDALEMIEEVLVDVLSTAKESGDLFLDTDTIASRTQFPPVSLRLERDATKCVLLVMKDKEKVHSKNGNLWYLCAP